MAGNEPHPKEVDIYQKIQQIRNPYNERDHGVNWHVSAHAWDMCHAEILRELYREMVKS